jgi:DNA-binding transcriptional ArsR family regulator
MDQAGIGPPEAPAEKARIAGIPRRDPYRYSRDVPPARGKRSGPSRSTGGDRDLASVGALVADRAKCQMLVALAADGGALPAGRLAAQAEVSASTASGHLHKLVAGGLLVVENVGRHRNYRLANPEVVAALIETLEQLAPALPIQSLGQSQQARAWRQARVCYDHIAGTLGVELMRALVERGHVGPVHEAARVDPDRDQYAITSEGWAFFETLSVVVPSSRQPVRHHKDSIEDGSHLSGALGRGLLTRFVDLGWLQRHQNRRLHITPEGRKGFDQQFGVSLDEEDREKVYGSIP